MSKTIQQLSARREEMRQMQASLESQVSLLRKEVKAKREGKRNGYRELVFTTNSASGFSAFSSHKRSITIHH